MRIWYLVIGLAMILTISSEAYSRTWSSPALQRAYFAKVAQISRGIVRPLEDKNTPILNYPDAIFEVDLEGNGSKYIASFGRVMVAIRSAPPGVEISHILEENEPRKVIERGKTVLLILNSRTGRLTIMPAWRADGELRPVRWTGKNRYIPDGTDCVSLPRDRDAVTFGEIGSSFIYRHGRDWKVRHCVVA